jgi:3beta-hydroxy-delta5-steroid dehydrogenase/steroid delta-isomerase
METPRLPLELSGLEDTQRPTAPLGVCLVTGGAGYLGRHLAAELARRGYAVRVLDLRAPSPPLPGVEGVLGDITSPEDVRKACAGVDTVFHTAAVLDWSRWPTPAQRERSLAVNVRGVENVVRAAREAGVRRLVHTSTNNVTLDGPVLDGDESRPYAARPRDLYTETKIAGERIALAANGAGFATCAIRPGGIYGPGDPTLLPQLVKQLAAGRYVATIGDGRALSDNTFVMNLVDGEIEAARHLVPGSPLCGQAYFVTDGQPINYFDFFRPYVEALGFRQPRLRVPGGLVHALAAAWEWAHARLGAPPPLLRSLEVRKIAVSHYNRIDRARRDFGWSPRIAPDEAFAACLDYCRRLMRESEVVDRPHWAWWLAILGGMGLTGALAISDAAYGWFAAHVAAWLPQPLIGAIFVWACWLHVKKGLRAVQLAERAGLRETALGWGWQTFLLGFASLGLLERRIARRAAERDASPDARSA